MNVLTKIGYVCQQVTAAFHGHTSQTPPSIQSLTPSFLQNTTCQAERMRGRHPLPKLGSRLGERQGVSPQSILSTTTTSFVLVVVVDCYWLAEEQGINTINNITCCCCLIVALHDIPVAAYQKLRIPFVPTLVVVAGLSPVRVRFLLAHGRLCCAVQCSATTTKCSSTS